MHDAKARVHQSELGSLCAAESEERNLTRKRWQKKEKEMIRQIRVTTKSIELGDKENRGKCMKRHAKPDAKRDAKRCDAMQCYAMLCDAMLCDAMTRA